MRTRTLFSLSLLLLSGFTAFGQDSSDMVDKAPAPIEEALRARVAKFYDAFVTGKFKDAYLLTADDSQNAFLESSKYQYKGFEIIKIRYSDNFTKAVVVTAIKSDLRWQGAVTLSTLPLTSNWVVVDGQWYWHYVKPTMMPSPFSPTGFVPIPPETTDKKPAALPANVAQNAHANLAKVGLDKETVQLRSYETSQDVIHVRNDMPGPVALSLDKFEMAGLKITVGKTGLQAHEETTILFAWRPDDPGIQCSDCIKKMSGRRMITLRVQPTAQVFPINIDFQNISSPPPAPQPPPK